MSTEEPTGSKAAPATQLPARYHDGGKDQEAHRDVPSWEGSSLRARPPCHREGAGSLLECLAKPQLLISQQEQTSRVPSTGAQLEESLVTSPPFDRNPSHALGPPRRDQTPPTPLANPTFREGDTPAEPAKLFTLGQAAVPTTHRLLALLKEQALFRRSGGWSARETFRWQVT